MLRANQFQGGKEHDKYLHQMDLISELFLVVMVDTNNTTNDGHQTTQHQWYGTYGRVSPTEYFLDWPYRGCNQYLEGMTRQRETIAIKCGSHIWSTIVVTLDTEEEQCHGYSISTEQVNKNVLPYSAMVIFFFTTSP